MCGGGEGDGEEEEGRTEKRPKNSGEAKLPELGLVYDESAVLRYAFGNLTIRRAVCHVLSSSPPVIAWVSF